MASAEREPITGVYNEGLGAEPPSGGPGAEPPVGFRGAKPPKAERLFVFACATEAANLPHH